MSWWYESLTIATIPPRYEVERYAMIKDGVHSSFCVSVSKILIIKSMDSIAGRLSDLPETHYPHKLKLPTQSSRKSHLLDLLSHDPSIFLERHGHLLTHDELQTLGLLLEKLPYDYSIQFHLSRLSVILDPNPNPKLVKSRSVAVKNRRRAYLETLVQNGEYFSEEAMREREPYLHYELVGRYQDPVGRMMPRPGEKWSETLLRRCEEAKIVENIRGEQIRRGVDKSEWIGGGNQVEEEEEMEEAESEEESEEGDEEKVIEEKKEDELSSSKPLEPLISEEEMQEQLEQFTSIMHQKFLSGEDSEHLDYSKIDEDERLDDYWSREASLDAEEKYFDED